MTSERRRLRSAQPTEPEDRLQRFVLADWYDPAADPAAPASWWRPGESKRESTYEWHAIQAIKRYQAARRSIGLIP